MSLRDGSKKMSKSEVSDLSRLNLKDSPEQLYNKVMKAKTDSLGTVKYDRQDRPEVSNLIQIYGGLADLTNQEVEHRFNHKNTREFKEDLAELTVKQLYPIQLAAE